VRHGEGACTIPINKFKVIDKIDGKVTQWEGISIEMIGVFNDHQDGKWSAKTVPGHENVILLTEPSLPKSMASKKSMVMHDVDEEDAVKEGRAIAMTALRKAIKKSPNDESIAKQKLLVWLPPEMKLSNKPFQLDAFKDDANVDVDVNIDYIIVHIQSETGWKEELDLRSGKESREVCTCTSWIKWRFVDLATQVDIAAPKKKKSNVDKLGTFSKFSNMNIASSSDEDDGEF